MKTYLVRSKRNNLLYPVEDPYDLDLRTVKSRLAKYFEDGFDIIGRFKGEVEWISVDGLNMRFTEPGGTK